ncbi:MAG: hypothetical protein ACLPWG_05005 [Steroidobacteraceae bacterium]|jgi:hypothetical protein
MTRNLRLLIAIPVLSIVAGALSANVGTNAVVLLQSAGSIALIVIWFLLDARDRKYRASWGLRISMVALTVVALPYYLFRSRGGSGGIRALGATLALLIVSMVGYGVTFRLRAPS